MPPQGYRLIFHVVGEDINYYEKARGCFLNSTKNNIKIIFSSLISRWFYYLLDNLVPTKIWSSNIRMNLREKSIFWWCRLNYLKFIIPAFGFLTLINSSNSSFIKQLCFGNSWSSDPTRDVSSLVFNHFDKTNSANFSRSAQFQKNGYLMPNS